MNRSLLVFIFIYLITTGVRAQDREADVVRRTSELTLETSRISGVPGSELLRREENRIRDYLRSHPEAFPHTRVGKTTAWNFSEGDTRSWWATDFTDNEEYLVASTCRAVGVHCYIFVADSLWEEGGNGRVTRSGVDSIRTAFDTKTPANPSKGIFLTDVETFGQPPDVDNDPRIIILILDIRDGYEGSGSYTAGYFFSVNEYPDGAVAIGGHRSNKAEIFYMDGDPLNLTDADDLKMVLSVTAHEFQHMIHWNNDWDEWTFINEGCSEIASVICGYPLRKQGGYINETNIPLFIWRSGDEVLRDYARAARWTLYLSEQFPNGFLRDLVATDANGILGINQSLAVYDPPTPRRFIDIFEDWLIANYADDLSPDPRYDYTYQLLPKVIPGRTHLNPNVPTTLDTVQMLGAQYITFTGGRDLEVTFQAYNTFLAVRALKIGSFDMEDVNVNEPFFASGFGTDYNEITFVLINKSQISDAVVSYTASGTMETQAVKLAYNDGEPDGYLSLTPGDTIAVVYNGLTGTRLDSLRIAFRRPGSILMGVNRYSGALRLTPIAQSLITPITVECLTEVSTVPYPVPYDNWVSVDLVPYGLDASEDFIVWFLVGNNPDAPGVMVSAEPDEGVYHSITYYQNEGGDDWYTLTDGEENLHEYMVHAYLSTETGIDDGFSSTPKEMTLYQNAPNPFNASTTISYRLPDPGYVSLRLYDLLGRERSILIDEQQASGLHRFTFEAGPLHSGIYIYRLTAGRFSQTKKLTILR